MEAKVYIIWLILFKKKKKKDKITNTKLGTKLNIYWIRKGFLTNYRSLGSPDPPFLTSLGNLPEMLK